MTNANTMRALVLDDAGGAPLVRRVPVPVPHGGLRSAHVVAAALNPTDMKRASRLKPDELPRVLGLEGVVEFSGRLYYANRTVAPHGTFAEATVVDPGQIFVLPPHATAEHALIAGISGLAAWLAIEHVAQMQAGETVLVFGTTGVVGQTAAQIARHLGAHRVVGVGRNSDALDQLVRRGVLDDAVPLDTPSLADDLVELTEGGASLVIDTLFGARLSSALRATRLGGRIVTVGADSGVVARIPFDGLLGRSLLTHRNSMVSIDTKRQAFEGLVTAITSGSITLETEECHL